MCLLLLVGVGCSDVSVSTDEEHAPDLNTALLPIIDFHTHVNPGSQAELETYVDDLVQVGRENGIDKMVMGLHASHVPDRPPTYSSEHDEWALAAAERYPDVIIPALNGFDPADSEAVEYVREQLETGKWKVIGELDLRNKVKQTKTAANTSTMMEIFELAGESGVPVIFHYDFDYGTDAASGIAELTEALDQNPDTIFIYAHTCGTQLVSLMEAHENLYCEHEFGRVASGVDMDRVVLGTDMQLHAGRWDLVRADYERLIGKLRDAISSWSDDEQEKTASLTPAALLNL